MLDAWVAGVEGLADDHGLGAEALEIADVVRVGNATAGHHRDVDEADEPWVAGPHAFYLDDDGRHALAEHLLGLPGTGLCREQAEQQDSCGHPHQNACLTRTSSA